jgi:hypothetical protein
MHHDERLEDDLSRWDVPTLVDRPSRLRATTRPASELTSLGATRPTRDRPAGEEAQ